MRDVVRARRAAGGSKSLRRPTGAKRSLLRSFDVEVGQNGEPYARHQPKLRQNHRAKLAGADECDAHGAAGRFALLQFSRKVHCAKRLAIASATSFSTPEIKTGPAAKEPVPLFSAPLTRRKLSRRATGRGGMRPRLAPRRCRRARPEGRKSR